MFAVNDIRLGLPVEAGSVDFIYADTLFGTGRKFEHYDDDVAAAHSVTKAIINESNRALKDGGILALHCDQNQNYVYRSMLERPDPHQGLVHEFLFLNEIIWSYNSGGSGKRHIPHKHDTIYIFRKGSAPYTFNILRQPYPNDYGGREGFHVDGRAQTSVWSESDVWKVPRLTNNSRIRTGYSTEKPPDLILRLIETFTNELDTVVDPCCGSGASGVAASQCNRKYLGFDINPVAIETATNRKLS